MSSDRIYYSREAELNAMRNRAVLAIALLTFGIGIGVVLALLFAPSSGKTTRRDLAKNVEEGLQTGRDTVEPLIRRAEKEFDELKKNVDEHMK